MKPGLRIALLAAVTLAGLATVPTRGEDSHLERPKPRVAISAAERWRLRPTETAAIAPSASAGPRTRVAVAIPVERRNVRIVYPGLIEAR